MAASVFSIEGVQFVSGLMWQPLSEATSGGVNREVKALAKDLTFDLHVLRRTSPNCVGFANTSATIKPGVMSAAAVISKAIEIESGALDFIFAAEIPSGQWLYVAQRDGLILPDGDLLFPSEDAAKSRLLEDVSLGTWAIVMAPSFWGVKNSKERDFLSVIPRKKNKTIEVHKWWRLSHVDSSKAITANSGKILAALLIAGLVVAGYKYYKVIQHKKEMEAAALAAQQQILDAQGNVVPPEHPWKKLPVASDSLSACMAAISNVRLFPGNWTISSVNCTNELLTVAWVPQKKGWIEHLKVIQPNAVISMDGSKASITIPLSTSKVGYDEEVTPENDRLIEMYSASQRYGVKFKATPTLPPPAALPGQEVHAAAPKDWNEINWKAEDVTLPETVLAALDGNGFRLSAMSATYQGGKFIWTMEGIQYVK